MQLEGLTNSSTISTNEKNAQGGVHITSEDKADLKAFLLSLSDSSLINNPDFWNQ